jgi:hypothetical protein
MAAWLPVIKAAIPHIAQVVTVALPIFTSNKESADREVLIANQIEELQAAAAQNAASVKDLATQLKSTLEGLESAATDLQAQLKRQMMRTNLVLILAAMAIILSALALV